MPLHNMDEGLRLAIEKAGSMRQLAFALGIGSPALWEWKRVPAHRLLQVEAVTKIPREKLRPDLYRHRRKSVPA
jgi:DNA-binding transcriptional regulator YdaS (Cro superfamily)